MTLFIRKHGGRADGVFTRPRSQPRHSGVLRGTINAAPSSTVDFRANHTSSRGAAARLVGLRLGDYVLIEIAARIPSEIANDQILM